LVTAGYRNVHWHVELEDWEPWRTGPAIAADGIAGATAHGDGAVVLLHTWPGGTGDAIAAMIGGLAEAGATFVRIDELGDLP
jgi:peptidoglycan/xylan/chitin deacetylase (PgdA/CDA1 family)